jgi:F-type H+-transporting ATPase subunit b
MNNPLVQPDPGLYIWTIVTFLILVALLGKYAWRPLLDALERRQDAIRKSLDEARQAKQDLERVHAESAKIIAQARPRPIRSPRPRGSISSARRCARRRAEADGIVRTLSADSAGDGARLQQIRHEAVDLPVNIAPSCCSNVSKDDNARLIEDVQADQATERPS